VADAWIDPPAQYPPAQSPAPQSPAPQSLPEQTGRGSRRVTVALATTLVVIVLAVVVWARFLSGVSAAPVPVSVMDAVPAVAASPGATILNNTPSTDTPAPASAASAGTTAAAPQPQPTTAGVPQLASSSATEPPVDATWLTRVSAATGISRPALQAYAGAELELEREKPACHLGWNTLAGIGKVESNNGRTLTDAGYSTSAILGPEVEGGLHAEGPMQFMPGTWAKWGADGNGDGVADPNQIDDAALAAARYLCSYGELDTIAGWHAAVFGYNHLESYVSAVAANATLYAQRAAAIDG